MSDQLTKMAQEILAIENDLPFRIIHSYTKTDTKGRLPSVNDYELHIFQQTWGSTALGFGGIGGQAMTTANTYVFLDLENGKDCYVYFAGRFAYTAPYSETFCKDVFGQNVASVTGCKKYRMDET